MEIPNEVPVMTLPSATLFPAAMLPLYIFEPRYRKMLVDTLTTHRMFSVAMQKPDRQRESPCTIAGLGFIRASVDHPDGTSHLVLQGLTRVELRATVRTRPYRIASIRPVATISDGGEIIDRLSTRVQELVRERMDLGPFPFPFPAISKSEGKPASDKSSKLSSSQILKYLENLPDAEHVADLVSCALLPGAVERQTILETANLTDRLKHLVHFLMAEIKRQRKDTGHE